jgi:CRP-like cAMP-binding protein
MSVGRDFSLQPLLDKLKSHSKLAETESQVILNLPVRVLEVQAHRDFVRLGETVDHACFVASGLVGRFGQNAEGVRQITAFHVPGDTPDLHSLMLPDATSGLQALTTTTILKIPHEALRSAIGRFPAVAEALWRECVMDAAILAQWALNVGRRDSKTRVAHLLCEMAVRYGADVEPSGTFAFPVTQSHLADATAMTPVHVNRTLMGLRHNELARVSFGKVEILDWNRLQEAGEFDRAYLAV